MNLSYLLNMDARKYPDKEALVMGEQRLTYQAFNSQVNHLANVLQQKGLQRADKVVLIMPNVPEFAISYFAIIRAGGIAVPIAATLKEQEIAYIVGDCQPRGLLSHEALMANVQNIPDQFPLDFAIKTGEEKAAWQSWQNVMQTPFKSSPHYFKPDTLTDDDPIDILYTSGTTGHPKGVRFSHRNVLTVAQLTAIEFEMNEDSHPLHMMPLSHSAPLHLVFAAGIVVGATHIFSASFKAELLLKLTETERVTHFFGAPVAYLLSLQEENFSQYDLSSGKYWIYGGAPLSPAMSENVEKGFGRDKLVCVYGLTEAGPSGSLLHHRDHPEKAGSIGNRAALFTELDIVDDHDQPVTPGDIGEIRLRGEGNMLGYLNKPEATDKAMKDGWVYSGDLVREDEDGFIWVIDRKKDMIISGGKNIYPREIEIALEAHPDIEELAVIGVPHEQWGETVKAYIVLSNSVQYSAKDWLTESKSFLADKLDKHKIPRDVEVLAQLPRNSNGKVLKHELRAQD